MLQRDDLSKSHVLVEELWKEKQITAMELKQIGTIRIAVKENGDTFPPSKDGNGLDKKNAKSVA